jgi:DNA invertase Pin-like site-specific DNA recombinase
MGAVALGQLRAVVAVRLSDFTDTSTSPERQTDAGNEAARDLGARVVGYPVDLDVSASKTTPWERPQLAEWLNKPDEFDVLIWWRMDRAVRSMADMSALGHWAREHNKRLVFAEGPTGGRLELDMGSATGELMAILMAFAAQMEAQAIRERVTGSRAQLRRTGRWGGGQPPYGTQPIPNPDGPGVVLGEDADAVQVLRYGQKLLHAGMRPHPIAEHLNGMAIPNATRHFALKAGTSTDKAGNWTGFAFKKIMRNPALLGYAVHGGTIVRDERGEPVIVGPEIFTREEFDAVGAILDEMENPNADKRPRKDSGSRMLNVGFCGGCGGKLYPTKPTKKAARRYMCRKASAGVKCARPVSIRADWLEDYAEREFLKRFGRMDVVRVVSHGGYDPGPEMDEVTRELRVMIARLTEAKTRTTQAVWQERVDALEARAATLEATPVTEPYEEQIPTGEKYAAMWHNADDMGKRRMMQDAGVRIVVRRKAPAEGKTRTGRVTRLDESLLSFDVATNRDPVADAEAEALYQATS